MLRRKTYGHLYISALFKLAALLGCPLDSTQYSTIRTTEDMQKIFRKLGLTDTGSETLYDPDTGMAFESRVFVSNHYWERQSHLVENKLNLRCFGPVVPETGQPTRGKRRHGGQSVDRMSFDSQSAAGICEIMRDIHLNQGSKITMGVCKKCNCTLGYQNAITHEWVCPQCGKHDEFIIRDVPPATMLMTHALNGAHIALDYVDNPLESIPEEDEQEGDAQLLTEALTKRIKEKEEVSETVTENK